MTRRMKEILSELVLDVVSKDWMKKIVDYLAL